MKRILSVLLAACLLLSLSVTTLAAETREVIGADGQNPSSITVTGLYQAGAVETKVSVDITWDEMVFTYTLGSRSGWDPVTHTYSTVQSEGWVEDPKTITVTNHSNTAVSAAFSFVPMDAYVKTIYGSFTSSSFELASAENVAPAQAPFATTDFSIDGNAIDAPADLGTIYVAVSSVQNGGNEGGNGGVMPPEPNNNIDTFNDLQMELECEGKRVILNKNIDMEDDCLVLAEGTTLDLNGYALIGRSAQIPMITTYTDTNATVCNGSIINAAGGDVIYSGGGNLTLENLLIESSSSNDVTKSLAYYGEDRGTGILRNCTLVGNLLVTKASSAEIATVEFFGQTQLNGIINDADFLPAESAGTIYCNEGTYNFNPTRYLKNRTDYMVISNGSQSWVVEKVS